MQSRICMNMISSAEAVCQVDLERLLPFVDLVKMESRKQRLLRNLDEVILEMVSFTANGSRVVGCSDFGQVLRWMLNVEYCCWIHVVTSDFG